MGAFNSKILILVYTNTNKVINDNSAIICHISMHFPANMTHLRVFFDSRVKGYTFNHAYRNL